MNNKRSQLCLILAEPGVLVQTHWTQYIKKSFTISDKYARPVTMSWGTGQQFDFWDIYIAQKLKTVVYAYWLNGRRNYPTTTNKTAFESHTKMENKKCTSHYLNILGTKLTKWLQKKCSQAQWRFLLSWIRQSSPLSICPVKATSKIKNKLVSFWYLSHLGVRVCVFVCWVLF